MVLLRCCLNLFSIKFITPFLLGCVFCLVLFSNRAHAHHSFAAEFDANQSIKFEGIVTKVEWTNPHVWIYINVKDATTGKTENWGAELGPPHLLQRRGWLRESLALGTKIEVDGFMARNGSKRVNAKTVTIAGTGTTPGQKLDAASSKDTKSED